MRNSHLLTTLMALSSVTTAWPWPPSFEGFKAVHQIDNLIFGRQHVDKSKSESSASVSPPTSTSPPASITSPPSSDSNTSAVPTQPGSSASNPKSGVQKTDSPDKTDSSSSPAKTTLVPINPVDPAGGVSLINPAITSGAQYYKIGDWVTFSWNYTSLLRDPKAINVLASLSQSSANGAGGNTATFTLTQNMTYEATPTILWDTNDWTTSATPLAPGTYTLIIYDADASGGISAIPSAGYLGLYDQYTFGMYTPAAYTALAPEYQCATCNSAFSPVEKMTFGFLFAMAGLTVLSFTWFASGSGILF